MPRIRSRVVASPSSRLALSLTSHETETLSRPLTGAATAFMLDLPAFLWSVLGAD